MDAATFKIHFEGRFDNIFLSTVRIGQDQEAFSPFFLFSVGLIPIYRQKQNRTDDEGSIHLRQVSSSMHTVQRPKKRIDINDNINVIIKLKN
jgi:hypothetical protein